MKKQTGYTLIEIMIALVLGLIVVGATISIYITAVGSSSSTIKSTRLNHDMESMMTLMLNDIKRAGYWGSAADGNINNNPFTDPATNIQIHDNGQCILYSYDATGNGSLVNTKFYGFKLEDNRIKIRLDSAALTTQVAGCASDDDNNWQEFMENSGNAQLRITTLEFSFGPITTDLPSTTVDLNATSRCYNLTQKKIDNQLSCTGGNNGDYLIQNRMVNIRMVGELNNDPSIKKTLLGTVEVRNNRICTWDGATCP
jgi:prepilin peptidase dependent protein B